MQDRFMVIIDHQQESALNESDGHVRMTSRDPKDQNRDPQNI